jgi:hypothetical protein
MMTTKLSKSAQWMLDHPYDEPCPKSHSDAQMWRRKRGIEVLVTSRTLRIEAKKAEYERRMKRGPLPF